ncbi:MAG: redoxin domain-containing protein [Deltaproteobacteria bacterium]|nr:redoxin domain-containing protein [Deltaproteobacteria bacterium]MBW2361068.1 redoxin domain-containing protein [Deltaproteobacteria bacterium]
MRNPGRTLLLAMLLLACSDPTETPNGDAQAASPSASAQPVAAKPDASAHNHRKHARPLPAFWGWGLDNRRIVVSELLGKRLLLYFFNPETDDATTATPALTAVAKLRGEHNFQIVGIATGSDRATVETNVAQQGIDFPVIDDSDARLAQQFALRGPVTVIGADAEGYVSFGLAGFGTADSASIETMLRKAMRLPESGSAEPSRPRAPTFTASILDADARFDLADHAGKPVVLVFFLHTCSHCHHALTYLKRILPEIPEEQRPTLVGVEITGRTYAVRSALREAEIDFFPVLFDDDGSIQAAYRVVGAVPDIFFIGRDGRIDARLAGWAPESHEPLTRMRTAKIAGAPVPMILNTQGYSGNEVCSVCHEVESETWSFTTHASAFDTLVKHGADTDRECVGCHVVGFGEPGGFVDAIDTPGLEDVGCESCHGRGGPHLSPDVGKGGDYGAVCATCHNPTHSLGFDYATFSARISHRANTALIHLPPEEKAKLLAERGRPGGALLPTAAATVGSEACRGCHTSEFETWAASPHAHALETLSGKGRAGDADCLACHTTAFGREGGFPASGTAASHSDLGRVGCESCHGPGGDHVAEGSRKLGSILSLGDKCDSCVILKICGDCHDDANDPGFEFAVEEKIENQRHGTIEAGTGKPTGSSAGLRPDDPALATRAIGLAAGS